MPNTFIITIDGEEVYTAEIGGPEDHAAQAKSMNDIRPIIDARMTATVKVTAGPHDVGFTFRERPGAAPGRLGALAARQPGDPLHRRVAEAEDGRHRRARTRSPASARRRAASGCSSARRRRRPRKRPVRNRILLTVAKRAYRRPVTAADVEAPLAFYTDARTRGESFDAGIRVGPGARARQPLFPLPRRARPRRPARGRQPSGERRRARVAALVLPLEQHPRPAAHGPGRRPAGCAQPGVLAAQVTRMLADPRADALVSNFTGQWLQLRNLESKVQPDILMFPDFDDNIREAFRTETEMLFAHILREKRSALELLSADYTFVNERLAKHYGIPGVYGTRFRQVKLTDPNRFGLLGHGSILSLTSVATRTSPVYRGKYVLSTFLNTPPPPPLPNVPTLEESNKENAPKTVREQLERHRTPVVCASCHRVIDPPGFALEHFNSVGQWRTKGDNGGAIDSGGVLADGTKVDGPVALRERHPRAARRLRHRADRAAHDLRSRPRRRAVGHAGRPRHRPQGRARQLSSGIDRSGHHRQRAVPDAHQAGTGRDLRPPSLGPPQRPPRSIHDHHEEAPVAPHLPAGHFRRRRRAAVPRRHGAGADGAVADGGRRAVPVRRHLHAVRRVSRRRGTRRRTAPTSSSSR